MRTELEHRRPNRVLIRLKLRSTNDAVARKLVCSARDPLRGRALPARGASAPPPGLDATDRDARVPHVAAWRVRLRSIPLTLANGNLKSARPRVSGSATFRIPHSAFLSALQPLRKLVQEEADVGHDPERLRRAAVGKLRDDGGIDIDAHDRHPRRKHVAHTDPVQHR
jgi:hypothetical protein